MISKYIMKQERNLRDLPDGFSYFGEQVPKSANKVWLNGYIFYIAKNCISSEHTPETVNAMANAGHEGQELKPDPSTNLVT